MILKEIYKINKTVISFEIFPPDTSEKIEKLLGEIEILKNYSPQLISLTCGAGGKGNLNTKSLLTEINQKFNIEIMPHFTCMCSSSKAIDENLHLFNSLGIQNILALRGDIPEDTSIFCCDFHYANELVEYLKHKTDFSIAVAGYPEGHIESLSIKEDIENLKKKIDAGADAIFTQMFFENDKFLSYLECLNKAGINVPVIAGIMPVISAKQLEKMTKLARITIPPEFKKKIIEHADDKNYIKQLGIDFSTNQCRELIENKVNGLHFFTLNRAYSTSKILDNLL